MGHVIGGEVVGVLETAVTRRSPLAGLDGRVRIIVTAVFAVTVVSLSHFGPLLAALAGAVAIMLLARLPIARTLRRVVAMDAFIVFMIATLPFTVPGEPLFSLFGFPASREGMVEALTIALKANTAVLAAMALLSSFDPVAFGRALARLGMPEPLVHLILFNVRYIDVLDREYQRLRVAMRARGFRPSNSRHTYVSFGYLIGMLLIRALERSERILQAMKCRGFSGRLFLDADERIGQMDVVFAAVCGAFVGGLVLWEMIIRATV
ncbi:MULTISPECIES: cobalt ECF transporter T component CbiQ [Rhodopseudomonas]|uniref:Cobalt ABC transporter permease n=1 Tax=Rhodopseudomonas palustris TaxID=1076 RepID=A0A0D7F2F1_RHOPL|nr:MULTISPECIES: cobalt ECF transporter T component CbiQ [Rhodopseudomonas]KIZ47268.1 cobalt ABC transporter permease [Rhodopseudomonas palustris]MDF3810703.1 cobalt ECF transporter T component CbiQ [Rhodopseudomonas sp. BAL398]WOK18493.1 cobalt ECF transporter T component CbiQ [Rhodopseudomonas sp. BAL398]